MKFISLFTKTPSHKRFTFTTRYFDDQEEERKEREERIRKEVELEGRRGLPTDAGHRTRIAGSFRTAKKSIKPRVDPSTNMLRLLILLLMVIFLIGYLQFGNVVAYGLVLLVPFYLYVRLRNNRRD